MGSQIKNFLSLCIISLYRHTKQVSQTCIMFKVAVKSRDELIPYACPFSNRSLEGSTSMGLTDFYTSC